MKKLLLLFLFFTSSISMLAQSDFYTVLPNIGSTSGNGRAPQGAAKYNRSVWLITAAEMTASGFSTNSIVNSIGFNYGTAQSIPTTGNLTVYLENTTSTTNAKSTTWATAISTMTTVSNGSVTIPATTGTVDFPFSGGTAFTYTGGALYVAFDYQNPTGTLSTGNVALCDTSLVGGLLGAWTATTTIPTTIAASTYRPETRLGKFVSCSSPLTPNTSNRNLTSIDLVWTGTGSTFDVEYGLANFTLGTGTRFLGVTGLSRTLTGLNNSTAYDYYVRKDCGGGSTSIWTGYPFYTTFIPTNTPYTTSFENAALPYVGWSIPNIVPVAGDWSIGYYGAGSTLTQNGSSSVASVTPSTVAADNWMFSRGVNLIANNQATITYYISNYQSSTTATGNYQLTVGNASTVGAQTTILATETGVSASAFTLKTYNFTPTTTGVYYFGFRNNTPLNAAGTHALIMDSFSVTQVLSITEFLNSKFSVSPNPANDFIFVTNSDNILVSGISITDLNGRVVKQNSYTNVSNIQVNVSDLASGIYMMNIVSDKGSVTKKIIKN